MVFQPTLIPNNAAANSLFNKEKRINSLYDMTVTFGTDAGATALATLTPAGLNNSTGKWGKWLAPDPTITTVTLTGATGGTFTLTVDGQITSAIAWNATAAVVQAALKAIGFGATVTLGSLIYTITWDDQSSYDTLPVVSGNIAAITGDISETSVIADVGTLVTAINPTVQTIDVKNASGGDFTITHGGQTTAAIAYNATPTAVEAALAALSSPSVVAVVHMSAATMYSISYESLADLISLPTVTATLSGLTGGTGEVANTEVGLVLVPDPVDLDIDVGTAAGGTFTVTVNGLTTAGIAFDATTAAVNAAILAASGVVTTTVLNTTTYTITFGALAQLLELPIVSGAISLLTGGAAPGVASVAGTAINGLNVVRGFVYPTAVTLHATEETMVVVSTKGEYFYDDIEANVAVGDQTALKTALKAGLIADGMMIQGLPGIA